MGREGEEEEVGNAERGVGDWKEAVTSSARRVTTVTAGLYASSSAILALYLACLLPFLGLITVSSLGSMGALYLA